MFNLRGYFGVLSDALKSERLVVLAPIVFVNFFGLGYVLHGVVFGFKELGYSQVIICVTMSVLVFFGEFISLLIPTKVLVDRNIAPQLRGDREIIRLTFDEQEREVFRRMKLVANSLTLILTGLVNYLLICFFIVLWLMGGQKPLDIYFVANSLIPVYILFIALNFIAAGYDLLRGKAQ